jgi:hypothetical protein
MGITRHMTSKGRQHVLACVPRSLEPVFGCDHGVHFKGFPLFFTAFLLHCNKTEAYAKTRQNDLKPYKLDKQRY